MKYLKMLPYQIRAAIDANVPVVLPMGVIEYHAEHLPVGVDCFTCIEFLERVERRHPEMVLLPPRGRCRVRGCSDGSCLVRSWELAVGG